MAATATRIRINRIHFFMTPPPLRVNMPLNRKILPRGQDLTGYHKLQMQALEQALSGLLGIFDRAVQFFLSQLGAEEALLNAYIIGLNYIDAQAAADVSQHIRVLAENGDISDIGGLVSVQTGDILFELLISLLKDDEDQLFLVAGICRRNLIALALKQGGQPIGDQQRNVGL